MSCACRFGAGWWCLIDALVYSKVVLNEGYPFSYNLPGIVATVALIMMNLVSRDDLANMADAYSSDEGSEVSFLFTRGPSPYCQELAMINTVPGSLRIADRAPVYVRRAGQSCGCFLAIA